MFPPRVSQSCHTHTHTHNAGDLSSCRICQKKSLQVPALNEGHPHMIKPLSIALRNSSQSLCIVFEVLVVFFGVEGLEIVNKFAAVSKIELVKIWNSFTLNILEVENLNQNVSRSLGPTLDVSLSSSVSHLSCCTTEYYQARKLNSAFAGFHPANSNLW